MSTASTAWLYFVAGVYGLLDLLLKVETWCMRYGKRAALDVL